MPVIGRETSIQFYVLDGYFWAGLWLRSSAGIQLSYRWLRPLWLAKLSGILKDPS